MFKSLIFIRFGFVILASYHSQDKRLVRVLYINPVIKILYTFSCLCLIGLPFLRAFFSKDFIIEKRIEFREEMRGIFFLLVFLGVRIYYSFKLLQLNKNMFVYYLIEKQSIGLIRIIFIIRIRILIINVFISLIFSLRLEVRHFKFFIYLIIFFFVLLNLLTNMNFKLNSYDKIKIRREI
jgi:NADH:ubiquinone oxidoreductase subunit 5 (subunit L)/multisubunit Na+/H+ antiporter MnhA subunit